MNGQPALWSSVVEGDSVLAADGAWWECVGRPHGQLTLSRPGREPVTRRAPAGTVRVVRGARGREMVRVAGALAGAGFTVEVLPNW